MNAFVFSAEKETNRQAMEKSVSVCVMMMIVMTMYDTAAAVQCTAHYTMYQTGVMNLSVCVCPFRRQ